MGDNDTTSGTTPRPHRADDVFEILALKAVEEMEFLKGMPEEVAKAVLCWPWRPFMSRTESLSEEVRLSREVGWIPQGDLHEWLSKDPSARDLFARLADRLNVIGHARSIMVSADLRAIYGTYMRLEGFHPLRPDWGLVSKHLTQNAGVNHAALKDMHILDIYRVLSDTLKPSEDQKGKVKRKQPRKRRLVPRPLTDLQREVYELRYEHQWTFEDIADRLECTPQNVAQIFRAAEKKMAELNASTTATGRSKSTVDGVSDGEYESGTRSADL